MNMFSMSDEDQAALDALDAGKELDAELEEEELEEEEVEEPVEDLGEKVEEEEAPSEPEPVVAPEEPKPDAAAFARMRYELKMLKEKESAPVQTAAKTEEPAELTFDEAFHQMRQELHEVKQKLTQKEQVEQRQTAVSQAAAEYVNEYEKPYAEKAPDYNNAATHVVTELSRAYRLLNPTATTAQVKTYCDNYVLTRASQAVNQGMNPAEYLHHVAYKEFGYTPKKPDAVPANDSVRRPDLTKVAENKKRSAGMAGAGGRGGKADLAPEDALELSTAEFSRLSPDKIEALIQQASGR